MKLSCVRYMLLLVPRSVVCPLCEGLCSFPRWQHLAVCSIGSGVPVQSVRVPFQPFSLMLFPVWHLSIVINGRASSDRSPGPMLVWVRVGLSYVMLLYVFVTLCVCMMHDVCIMLGSSLVFLAFFLLYVDKKKKKGYHVYFITTKVLQWLSVHTGPHLSASQR